MKKVILIISTILFILLISFVSYKLYFTGGTNINVQNNYSQEQETKEKPEASREQNTDKKIINTKEKIKQNKDSYKANLEKAINHILNDKITYRKNTLKKLLDEYNAEADSIYQSYLSDKENYKIYYKKLNEITGTISLYPDAICEELKPVFKKYDILIYPNTGCDSYIYENYIKEYDIKNSDELKELIDYHEASFQRIRKYEIDILE